MYSIPSFRIGEEIARFAFEVNINQNALNWFIGFTNPSAGPWKKIHFRHVDKRIEIGRYERDEKRPDIILFNEVDGICIIIEAKDDYRKLLTEDQLQKSVEVYKKEKDRIINSSIRKWVVSKNVLFIFSLLWASNDLKSEFKIVRDELFKMSSNNQREPVLLIAVKMYNDNLSCFGDVILNGSNDDKLLNLMTSLNLK